MTAKLEVSTKKPFLLFGVKGVEIKVDGVSLGIIKLGETKTFEVESGSHELSGVLHAVVNRNIDSISFNIQEGVTMKASSEYNRMTGTMNFRIN